MKKQNTFELEGNNQLIIADYSKQIMSWEADRRSAVQEIVRLLCNPKFH
jgi:hypothetical protein